MLEGLTPLHLILVLGIALLIVGPGKLPDVASAIGKSVREFRTSMSAEVADKDEEPKPPAAS